MKLLNKIIPFLCLLLGLYLVAQSIGKAKSERMTPEGLDLGAYAALPAQADGRIKPLDSVARNSLLLIYGKSKLKLDEGRALEPIQWLAHVQMKPEEAAEYPVFRIDNDQVLGLFGWQQAKDKYFSYNALEPHFETIVRQVNAIREKPAQTRTTYEQQLMKLYRSIDRYFALSSYSAPAIIPPVAKEDNDWSTMMEVIKSGDETQLKRAPILFYTGAIEAYRDLQPDAFNANVMGLVEHTKAYVDKGKIDFEVLFNRVDPFTASKLLYVFALVLAIFSWLVLPEPLRKGALWLLIIAVIVHTFGLGARMYLQGRPPVTNLYSSSIFVGWAAVLLGMLLEYLHKHGIGAAVAALIGFATLFMAPALSSSADTLEMMQAVLDSNFWLATHVVIISLGYSAMFLAGMLALVYVLRGVLTKGLERDTAKALSRMVYAIICFAMLFSFVGTMLGGVWADQSWGRFWGWDPKENGALLIVIWCALILHARWGGLVKDAGLMVLALFGNIVTAWSWFGTNMLGVGLHSYGFADKQFQALVLFVISQLLVMAMGLLPSRYWRSLN